MQGATLQGSVVKTAVNDTYISINPTCSEPADRLVKEAKEQLQLLPCKNPGPYKPRGIT